MQQYLPQGTILNGHYRIEQHLSSGGFGNTYLATDISAFNEEVAIKEFFLADISERLDDHVTVRVTASSQKLFIQQKEKFYTEAKRMYNFSKKYHDKHIVEVKACFEENNTSYYVMNYIDGESVRDYLKRTGKPLSEPEAERIIRDVAAALTTAYKENILHLDIKPANIMLDKTGNVYLIDFGASKQVNDDGNLTRSLSAMAYSKGYAPVEQIEQDFNSIGVHTDIYAIGATLYNLLTLQTPPMYSSIVDLHARSDEMLHALAHCIGIGECGRTLRNYR